MTIATLKKLISVLKGLEATTDNDLKPYFAKCREDAVNKLDQATRNEQAKKLVTAWNKHIMPVTGVKALESSWVEYIGRFDITLSVKSEGYGNASVTLGSTIQDSLKVIRDKQPTLLKYKELHIGKD